MTREENLKKLTGYMSVVVDSIFNAQDLSELPLPMRSAVKVAVKEVVAEEMEAAANKTYTDHDLEVLIEFYMSDTGQKALGLSKELGTQEFQLSLNQKLTDRIESILESTMEQREVKPDGKTTL
jgi:hypothetical protein